MLLIAGGALDPHLRRVHAAALARGLAVRALLVGPEHHPRLHVALPGGALAVDGEALAPTALFLRHDVFAWLGDRRPPVERRAAAWYEALLGWALLHPTLRLYNRRAALRRVNKLVGLAEAARVGLRVPQTTLSNDLSALRAAAGPCVAKPLLGGAYTLPLDAALDAAPREGEALLAPALVQERLEYPELRAQRVGRSWFAFEIAASTLDHREEPAAPARPVPLPAALRRPLGRLSTRLGLDLCAADFKRCPRTGEWVFLELNSQPMWTAFDTAAGGAITQAILDGLVGRPGPRRARSGRREEPG